MLKTSQDLRTSPKLIRANHFLRLGFRRLSQTWADFYRCRLSKFFRRSFDLTLSLVILGLTLLLIPFIWLANWFGSPGALFYEQERVGKNGRPFILIKFRTMVEWAEKEGQQFAAENDKRVTPVGRILRRTRLDEMPQAWNVLKGEMSIIGPRPERPHNVDYFALIIENYNDRHSVRPGITGWAQVHHLYGQTDEEAKIKLTFDLDYIKRQNLWLDILIIAKTVALMVGCKGR